MFTGCALKSRAWRLIAQASALKGTDPLLLIGIDPASAHVFVVSRPDQPTPGLPSGNYSFVRSQEPFLRPDLHSAGHGVGRRSMMAFRPPRTCAARSVIEGRLTRCQTWSRWGTSLAPTRWSEDYDATVTGGVGLVARRGGLVEDVAGGSGQRIDQRLLVEQIIPV